MATRTFSPPTSAPRTAGIASPAIREFVAALIEKSKRRKLMKPIGIIGGGLAGLSAACVLAARGRKVMLFERNDWLGGKAAQLRGDGFRFDMGPTIVTIPSVLRRIFSEAGARLEDYLELVRLDPQWRCFFDDGSVLDLAQNPNAMAQTLDAFAPGTNSGARYREFIDYSARLDGISQRHFFYKPIGGLRDMFEWKASFDPKMLGDVLAMRMGRSVAGTVRAFTPDPRVAQMIDHFTQYVGSSPYGSPAVLCGIAHMQTDEGVWYPIGGTRAVPEALVKLATELGVEFRTGTKIEKILSRGGEVTGVLTDAGEEIALSAVVSNCDSVRTHRELINGAVGAAFERRRKYEPACSGVVLYLGLNKRYEHLAHHDFVFSRDPHEEFDWIYKKGEPAPDPTCYLAATTCTEPGTAPPGGEALYVLVHAPYLRPHHDWKACCPSIGASFWKSSSAPAKCRTSNRASSSSARSRRRTSTTATTCSTARSTASRATGNSSAHSSPATAAPTCADFTSPAARRIPGPACRWC